MEQDDLYHQAAQQWGPALARLAAAVEAHPDRRAELLQDVHLQLWRSLAGFRGQCSLRTWVMRVAHNRAASHVHREVRQLPPAPEATDAVADPAPGPEERLNQRVAVATLQRRLRALPDLDRQLMLLWLEEFSAAEIGEILGISANAVHVRLHRLRANLTQPEPGVEP